MHQVAVTIPEAATSGLLQPPLTEHQLRVIIRALRIPPAGTRRDGHIGHPQHTYDWADIARLHAALSPWLARRDVRRLACHNVPDTSRPDTPAETGIQGVSHWRQRVRAQRREPHPRRRRPRRPPHLTVTRYRSPVADPLLEDKDFWTPVEGFRLVSVDGPWLAHPDITICTFDDDNAPAELEGKLVEPAFMRYADGHVTVTDRQLVPAS